MRVFIAVDLPEDIKEKVSEIQSEFRKSGADVNWVEMKKFHFTLKFIGEMAESKIEPIALALKKELIGEKSFEIKLGSAGVFPDFEKIRVVWLGVSQGEEKLRKLAEKIEKVTTDFGFEKEKRPFSAHLTLGRVKSFKNIEKLKKIILEFKKPDSLGFKAESVKIFQSILKPKGAQYIVLKEIKLD